jgi:hypothetical protein
MISSEEKSLPICHEQSRQRGNGRTRTKSGTLATGLPALTWPSSIIALPFVLLFNLSGKAQTENQSQSSIFQKGEKAPAGYFTRTVLVKSLVSDDTTFNCAISNVAFEPCARTNWHKHPVGQILLVAEDTGYYQGKASQFDSFIKEISLNVFLM